MSEQQHCVIIGAGHGASHLAFSLRKLGWDGSITVVGEEPHLPYHRPPLSKNYLSGGKSLQQILLRPAAAYESNDVKLRLSSRVESIDREQKTVLLTSGEVIGYSHLVLATGARARKLALDGEALNGVCYLRNADDVERIKTLATPSKRAVIVGGGYIGLEAAATLRKLGLHVTVVESMDRVLARVTSSTVSTFFERIHREEGVEIRTSTTVDRILGDQAVSGVQLSTKEVLDADLVIVGVGVLPNSAIAEASGLGVDDGVVVDEYCATDDASIFACGDCARGHHDFYGKKLRLESVQNANDQATTVARAICGEKKPYSTVPWFWSDQYDVKLQIAGLPAGYDDLVVRGSPDVGRQFSVVYLRDSTVISVDAINSPVEFVLGKKLLEQQKKISLDMLRNESRKLSECCTT